MLDSKAVAKIARLARIRITDSERELYAKELTNILKFVEQLNEVNTDGVAPLASVSDVALPWRADKVTDGNQQEAVLANAPKSDHGCFVVPKVME